MVDAKNILERVKQYGKLEYSDEDELIIGLINAAIDTLEATGVSRESESELYILAVERLALHYYENREEVGGGQPIPMGMNWMITHLRLKNGI